MSMLPEPSAEPFANLPVPEADFDDLLPDPPFTEPDTDVVFDQAGIDALFDFDQAPATTARSGLKAIIDSDAINQEQLPMLEVVCDRMVRTFSTSLRTLTSDAIEVSFDGMSSIRFGEYMNRLLLPAMIGVFKVREWENFGLVTVDSSLIYAVVDTFLGGRSAIGSMKIDGRGFTSIETSLVSRMIQLALNELAGAFEPIAEVAMQLERIETSPRFAQIAGPSNICAVASFRIDMEGRSGRFGVLLPYATVEPVRNKLTQRFMGEKLGRDLVWENHMLEEIRRTSVSIDLVLADMPMRFKDIANLKPGQTIALGADPDTPVDINCNGVSLGKALMGQRHGHLAGRVLTHMAKGASK